MVSETLPLYQKIENDLQFKIDTGQWNVGDRIPSEKELEKSYEVSRITVRRAINDLEQLGYLTRKRAKGTFVNDINNSNKQSSFTVVKSFAREMEELGKQAVTISAHVQKIPATVKLARFLNIKVNDPILELTRVRGADNQVITYGKTYIPYKKEYSLNDKDYYGSLYEYLSKFDVQIANQTEYIEAVPATKELCQKLQLKQSEPLLKRVRRVYNASNSYREYSINYYIGSRYRYYVEY